MPSTSATRTVSCVASDAHDVARVRAHEGQAAAGGEAEVAAAAVAASAATGDAA